MGTYYHVPFEDNKLDKTLKETVKGSKIAEYLSTEEEEEEKRGVWGAVMDLAEAGFQMYCYNEGSFEEICKELAESIEKLAPKEKELKEKLDEDEEEADEESEKDEEDEDDKEEPDKE